MMDNELIERLNKLRDVANGDSDLGEVIDWREKHLPAIDDAIKLITNLVGGIRKLRMERITRDCEWQELLEEKAALVAERDRLREALTPSKVTRAAYEHKFSFYMNWTDDDGDDRTEKVYVQWPIIMKIMQAISDSAKGTFNHD